MCVRKLASSLKLLENITEKDLCKTISRWNIYSKNDTLLYRT